MRNVRGVVLEYRKEPVSVWTAVKRLRAMAGVRGRPRATRRSKIISPVAVAVGVDVPQAQDRAAGLPKSLEQFARRRHDPAHSSPPGSLDFNPAKRAWMCAACSMERSGRKTSCGVARRSRCLRSQFHTKPRALSRALKDDAHCSFGPSTET